MAQATGGGGAGVSGGSGAVSPMSTGSGGSSAGPSGGASVPISTESGRTTITPATGGGSTGGGGGGGPATEPGRASESATGHVAIAPALGIQPISPAGAVPITPQLGFSMPSMVGVMPSTPAGQVQAFRMTNPHGMYFGHTQNWPSDVFQHTVHTYGFQPRQTLQAPWIPTADGYAEPLGLPRLDFDDQTGRPMAVDMSSSHVMNVDQTQNIERYHEVNNRETVDAYFDMSMNAAVHRSDTTLHQNSYDTSTANSQDFSSERSVDNSTNVEQVTNQSTVNVENRSADNRQETHIDNSVTEHGSTTYVESRDTTVHHDNSVSISADNSRTEHAEHRTSVTEVDNSVNIRETSHNTSFVENRETTVAYPETRQVVVDNSQNLVRNVENRFVDQDNSAFNMVEDRSVSLSTTQDPVYNFDNSTTIHLTQVIQAPERSGGSLFVGHA
ncbi:hypothetical protein GKC30_06340 [Pseudodesulfovibrio sp. F-1]|uniref:Uncharacterized protein n=1 Tax=Pseudodesulfovibrio alkaliphilus TaxID=2661613 RepID=A0A7K1KME4_9BACT|nr:hypothetical protein [Pseudodesulfovibrio alkaliphilus]